MELINLTPQEFERITKVIYERTGIFLAEEKLCLLSNRLRKRLRALKLDSFEDYYQLILDKVGCEEELPHFLSAVTTNETYFFRNQNLWRFIRESWIPEMMEAKKSAKCIRVWSAACSTGAEAYTVAICLCEGIADYRSWKIQVIGSDISQRVLDEANAGVYNDYAVSKAPEPIVKKWFKKTDEKYVIDEKLRKLVSFKFHNLREPFCESRFDLVFLRNVLMYFDLDMKLRALKNVQEALGPEGHLIVGDVDPVRNCKDLSAAMKLEYVGPNTYRKPKAVPASGKANPSNLVRA